MMPSSARQAFHPGIAETVKLLLCTANSAANSRVHTLDCGQQRLSVGATSPQIVAKFSYVLSGTPLHDRTWRFWRRHFDASDESRTLLNDLRTVYEQSYSKSAN